MVKRISSLSGHYQIGKYGEKDNIGIIINEIKDLILFQISTWPNTFEILGNKVAKIIELDRYPGPNKAIQGSSSSMLRVEPLKWWIIGQEIKNISIEEGTYLDISHSRTHIRISGERSIELLNRHLPIDLRDKSFAINDVATTVFHHVGVTLWRSKEGYELFIPRAYALSLWEVLLESSSQFGYEIK